MQRKTFSLSAPLDYLAASEEEIQRVVNQCGPDGFINHLVPDHIFGLNVSSACNIHDWDISKAKNQKDLKFSDFRFKNNLEKIVNEETKSPFMKFIRKGVTKVYFWAVRLYSKMRDFD